MQKTITLVRTIGHHWCENLYLDLTTDASIKEVKERRVEQGDMPRHG
jgi:hypothetical protein